VIEGEKTFYSIAKDPYLRFTTLKLGRLPIDFFILAVYYCPLTTVIARATAAVF